MSVFSEAADLIEQAGWTQKANARNKDGISVPSSSWQASCYCISGALQKVYEEKSIQPRDYDGYYALCDSIDIKLGQEFITWNDEPERTKEEVVSLLRSMDE